MLKIIITIMLLLIVLYALHFVIINIGNLKKSKVNKKTDKKNFFAIIIAARNEEEVIENLIESLKRQNYPKEKYEIYVITNNCTDNTAEVAENKGAIVIQCQEKVSTKGEVLKYTFNKLKNNKKIDAYAIFDADNIVDNSFLNEMNNTINEGYNVSQGFRDIKNIGDNWISSSYAILYYIDNLFINRARYNMNKSAFLNGTGFVVKKEIIDKLGFNPKTLVEDVEFTIICALNDEKIAFTETAITYDEQVTDFKTSLKQRKRWSYGSVQCIKKYYKDLLIKIVKDKSYCCLDILLFNMLILFQILTVVLTIITIIDLIVSNNNVSITNTIFISLTMTFLAYICGIILRIFLIKKYNKSVKDNIGGILLFDLFLLSWIPINFICLFINKCNWESIKHNRNIEIERA